MITRLFSKCALILFLFIFALSSCNRKNLWENEYLTNVLLPDVILTFSSVDSSRISFDWEDPAAMNDTDTIIITCRRVSDNTIVHSAIVGKGILAYTITGLVNDTESYSVNVTVESLFGYTSAGINFRLTPRSAGYAECYLIYTAEDLDAVRGSVLPVYNNWDLGDTYNLMADIDISLYNWVPMGDSTTAFTGTFEGNGHTISNLTITTAGNYRGLFGYIDNVSGAGIVNNLGLVNAAVTNSASSYTGTLAGYSSGDITGCYSTGSMTVFEYGGGLVGRNDGIIDSSHSAVAVAGAAISNNVGGLTGFNGGMIRNNSYAEGSVYGESTIGGLAGQNAGTITDSHSSGAVGGTDYSLGGLVGTNDNGIIEAVYAEGNVTGDNILSVNVGGLVGYNASTSAGMGTIENSYSYGNASGGGLVGGLVGYNFNSFNTITNCHASGSVTGAASNIGGLIGWNVSALITGCTASGAVAVINTANFVGGLIGQNSGEIMDCRATGRVTGRSNWVGGLVGYNVGVSADITDSTYVNTTYAISSSGTTYYVGGLVGQNVDGTITNSHAVGTISLDGANYKYIGGLAGASNGYITDGSYADIDIVITNGVNISYVGGLIGYASGAIIDDTGGYCYSSGAITVISNVGDSQSSYTGGLAGSTSATTITGARASGTIDVDIAVPVATAALTSNVYVGGLTGHSASTTISNANTSGLMDITVTIPAAAVSGTAIVYVGGLIGGYSSGAATITGTQSQGNINASLIETSGSTATTQMRAGGFIGENQGATLTTCRYITGTIDVHLSDADSVYTGGLVGFHLTGSINLNSYTSGTVIGDSATDTATGGLIGRNLGPIAASYSTANVTGASYTGGLVGWNGPGGTIDSSFVNSNTITGSASNTGGFAGYNEGIITNSDVTIIIEVDGAGNTGGFVGSNLNDVLNCDVTGNAGAMVSGSNYTGGFAGYNNSATAIIDECTAVIPGGVSGADNVGGFAGGNATSALIDNSYSVNTVSGNSYIGGFLGRLNGAAVTICYAAGNVIGTANCIGGFAGYILGTSSVENSYARGNVSGNSYVGGFTGRQMINGNITFCYSSGIATGAASYGGFCGQNDGTINVNCFFNDDNNNDSYATGATLDQMNDSVPNVFSIAGWAFPAIWAADGVNYPYFAP